MKPIVEAAEKFKINLSLETDLQPNLFFELLERFDSEMVTVNYDIGNSAALEYDPDEELEAYGNKITDIHIKDRVFGGGPVTLGEGNADFSKFFNKLIEFDYQGPFIMQAYRDEEGIEIFKKQLSWISKYLNECKVKGYE
jgi:L-ribulose-5-phosphate 3-epimerase